MGPLLKGNIMHTIAVLLLTVFLSNGNAVTTSNAFESVDDCRAAINPIVTQTYKLAKPVVVKGVTVRVTYIEGYCHTVTEGQHV